MFFKWGWPFLMLTGLVGLGACSFDRDNPNDTQSDSYLDLTIGSADSLRWTSDTVKVPLVWEGEADSLAWRLLGGGDSAVWHTRAGVDKELILSGLDDGAYTLECLIKGKSGTQALDTLRFTVDAVPKTSVILTPLQPLPKDSLVAVDVYLEGVENVLGVQAWLLWDHSLLSYQKMEAAWNAYADMHGGDSLEISAVRLGSAAYSGSGAVARLYFKVLRSGGTALTVLNGKTFLSSADGGKIYPSLVRGSLIP